MKGTRTTLLDLDWIYDILDLDLKNTCTTLLDSDWIDFILELNWLNELKKQAKMPLENNEDFLELSVKQLITQAQSP